MPDQTLVDCIEHFDDQVIFLCFSFFDSCHAVTTLDATWKEGKVGRKLFF